MSAEAHTPGCLKWLLFRKSACMCVVTLTLLITIVICYGPSMHIIYTSSIASYSYYMASIVGIISRQMDGLRLIDVAML